MLNSSKFNLDMPRWCSKLDPALQRARPAFVWFFAFERAKTSGSKGLFFVDWWWVLASFVAKDARFALLSQLRPRTVVVCVTTVAPLIHLPSGQALSSQNQLRNRVWFQLTGYLEPPPFQATCTRATNHVGVGFLTEKVNRAQFHS